jgi:hypothetical protein
MLNPVRLYKALRYTNQVNAHIKRVMAERVTFGSPAFEAFFDFVEANPSVQWVMIAEFDDKRPYTRDDLKDIFVSLLAGGVRPVDIMQTFAYPDALWYLARAKKRKEGHDVIVFTLKEHWERGQKLPVEPGVYTRLTKAG